MTDWAIPQQAKLKYTQLFNLHDRSRSGFLSGLQCRDILLQSGLPRNVLAEIWNLSDIDGDGQLTREEFILAMHLTNHVRSGQTLPGELPPELVPPSYRRTRSISATSVHSATSAGSAVSGNTNQDDQASHKSSDNVASSFAASSVLNSHSFEDKRRENFEKGRAELERRRLKIIEQQTSVLKEQLMASKKQVTEAKAKIDTMRNERDTKMGLITSLEAQLKTLQDRRAYLNQEELNLIAIAKDLNLVSSPDQAKLDQVATQAKQQSIDQMKLKLEEFVKEKENKMSELKEVTTRLDECRKELKTLTETASKTYETYKEKVTKAKSIREQLVEENKSKTVNLDSVWDSEPSFATPHSQAETTFLSTNEDPWNMNTSNDQQNAFTSSPMNTSNFLTNVNATSGGSETKQLADFDSKLLGNVQQQQKRYRALYAFDARNPDELTINPGDIIIGSEVVTEPGWLSGTSNGNSGLFPEAYVEPIIEEAAPVTGNYEDTNNSNSNNNNNNNNLSREEATATMLPASQPASESLPFESESAPTAIKYKVVYAFDARNPDELTINPGDIIIGIEGAHEPGWLMGEMNGQRGLFPEAYVEKMQESVQEAVSEAGAGGKLQRMSSVGSLRSKKSKSKKAEVATVIANYRALGQEQLNLEKGQLVLIRRKMDSGWWEGEVQVKAKQKPTAELGLISDRTRSELDYLIVELVETEVDYLEDLRFCHGAYILPLSNQFDVHDIFIKWNQLILVHESFTSKQCSSNIDYCHIFEAFQNLINNSKDLYIEYCSQQSESVRRFEAKVASNIRFKQLVNDCQRNVLRAAEQQVTGNNRSSRNARLPLTSFLLKPMQRMTKYSLLFDRIFKVVADKSSHDLVDVALQLKLSSQSLCHDVNEACRLKEDYEDNKRRLRWCQSHIKQITYNDSTADLQSFASNSIDIDTSYTELISFDSKTNCMGERRIIKAGSVIKSKSGKELILFLFNDLLLLTQIKGGTSTRVEDVFKSDRAQHSYYKLYKRPILLENLVVNNLETRNSQQSLRASWNEQQLLMISFTDDLTGYRCNVLAIISQEKVAWLKLLNQWVFEAKDARLRFLSQKSLKPIKKPVLEHSYGRLFITIQEVSKHGSNSSRDLTPVSNSFDSQSLDSRKSHEFYSSSATRICVTLQMKQMKNVIVNVFDEKKELVPISDLFKTVPIPVDPSGREEVFVQFPDESTQFLLENKSDCDSSKVLEICLLDDCKFKETQLLSRRRINIDQMLGDEFCLVGENSFSNHKISPNRPTELAFKMKSLRNLKPLDRQLSSPETRPHLSPQQASCDFAKQPDDGNYIIKLKFHLQLFHKSEES